MNLYDSIRRRKACRKYINEPLSPVQLEEISRVIDTFEPLYPDVSVNYRFVTETKGRFHVKAPHYLIISGEGKKGEEVNAGFIGQQFMLWLDSNEFGGVWLGASKDAIKPQKNTDIIILAFGKPEGSSHRSVSEFDRKEISDITNAPNDDFIKAMHLAPSGMNLQPWYFEKTNDKLLIYRQLLKPPLSLLYKLTKIDIGIALCHYAVACKHFGKPFRFYKGGNVKNKKGYEYFGYIDITE